LAVKTAIFTRERRPERCPRYKNAPSGEAAAHEIGDVAW
jgi:hypothetical protein